MFTMRTTLWYVYQGAEPVELMNDKAVYMSSLRVILANYITCLSCVREHYTSVEMV